MRSGRPGLSLALSAVMLLAGCTGAGSREPPEPGKVPAPGGLHLAAPVDEGEEDRHPTLRLLLDLVARTPAEERIRVVGNSFSYVPLAEALAQAHRRGVDVQVVLHRAAVRGWEAPSRLQEALGEDRSARSFVLLADGAVHQKSWTFTRTGSHRDVSLVGSMNLTYHSAGQYTDTWGWQGRADVRRLLDRRFVQLARSLPDPPPLGPVDLGRERLWFFPGYDEATDPVRRMLAEVPAAGARIRVVMYAWLDERGLDLARVLAARDAAGADVEVVLGASTGPLVREVLEGSGIEVHPGVYDDGADVHHKLAVVSHPAPDGGRERWVLTGSDNWTTKSLDRPELLLRLDGPGGGTWRRYDRWVDRLVGRGERERD